MELHPSLQKRTKRLIKTQNTCRVTKQKGRNMTMAITQAEYIWLDGAAPVQRLRSKSRIVALSGQEAVIETFPEWSFDGSSTYQASGNDSDLLLRPVRFIKDPLRGEGNYLVLCEVFNADGTPHPT